MSTTDEIVQPDPPTTVQKLLAEALGTFVLVFLGCGSVMYFRASTPDFSETLDLIGVADIVSVGLAFGLAVTMMAYAVGNISGGHFNPAVTLGAAIAKRIGWMDVPLYMVAQLLGAVVAAALLFLTGQAYDTWDADPGSLGANSFGDDGSGIAWWGAGMLELVLTFIFLMVILAVTDSRFEHPSLAPLVIGLTLAAIHFVAIPATGTSVNPARSLGPAIFSGVDEIKQVWLFFVFPLLGAALAGLLYPILFGADSPLGRLRPAAAPRDAYQAEWNQQQWGAAPGGGYPQAQQAQQAWPQPGQQAPQAAPTRASWPAQQPVQEPQQQWPQAQQPQQGASAPPPNAQQPAPPQAAPQQAEPQQQGWPQGQGQSWQQGQWPQQDGDDDGRTQIRPQR